MIPTNESRNATLATAASVLLLAGGLACLPGKVDEPTLPAAGAGLQDAALPDAGTAPPAPSPPRRLNSSLSMPYFSFAKSLNSRS